jgi:carotenoid cleavage dioxygenase-like enzyme
MEALMAGGPVIDALAWRPERGSRLLVVSRDGGEQVASIPIGESYCLHQVNCYEEGDRLVVDVLELEEPVYPDYQPMPDLFGEVAPARPVRLVVDLAKGTLERREELAYRLAADFPAIDTRRSGRPYRRFWVLSIGATGRPGRKFFDRLECIDWDEGGVCSAWQAPAGRYLGGEPIFLGDPEATETGLDRGGAVICQELDPAAGTACFLIFDSGDLARGPLARLPLRSPIPPGFHAAFEPAA